MQVWKFQLGSTISERNFTGWQSVKMGKLIKREVLTFVKPLLDGIGQSSSQFLSEFSFFKIISIFGIIDIANFNQDGSWDLAVTQDAG